MAKLILLALACGGLTAAAQLVSNDSADSPVPGPLIVAGPFDWNHDLQSIGRMPGTTIGAGYPDDVLPFTALSTSPTIYTLRTLGPAIVSKIVTKHYAITGHIRYSGVATGSFLEMESWFAPEQPGGAESFYYSRTLGEAGPLAKIEGSDDNRDFALPFDATGTKTPLVRLVMKLHVMGAGDFQISNVRLVQYPDAVAAAAAISAPAKPIDPVFVDLTQAAGAPLHLMMAGTDYSNFALFDGAVKILTQTNPGTSFVLRGTENVAYSNVVNTLDALRRSSATNIFFANDPGKGSNVVSTSWVSQDGRKFPSEPLDWRSFILGVLAAVAAIFGAAALFVLGRRFRSLRHTRELRRIASLDG